jgi:RHS repeat-associated protein
MVETAVGSTYTQIVYSPMGNKFATMNGQTTLVSAFIPLPGAQAVYTQLSLSTSNKVAYYRHADHLGSSRLATTPTQTMYSSTAYAPDGEPYSQAGATDLSFTGQDQDTVPGIHDFLFRKYPPVQGRWLSPDPGGLAVADPTNPQSWNRYAYVQNNPMSLVDPLGLECYWEVYYHFGNNGQIVYDRAEFRGCDGTGAQGAGSTGNGPGGATIEAYHPPVSTCVGQAALDGVLDLTSLDLAPHANQDDWHWSSGKNGFVYTGEGVGLSPPIPLTEPALWRKRPTGWQAVRGRRDKSDSS